MPITLVKTNKAFPISTQGYDELLPSHKELMHLLEGLHISSIVVGERSTLVCYRDTLLGPLEISHTIYPYEADNA